MTLPPGVVMRVAAWPSHRTSVLPAAVLPAADGRRAGVEADVAVGGGRACRRGGACTEQRQQGGEQQGTGLWHGFLRAL
ncbi:hypothetical protein OJJOAM_004513 [Cupriavidus sp. H18C1]